MEEMKTTRIISVMFVPQTEGGELARRLRETEIEMEKQSGFRIKIVERTGLKIVDLLHKADPWQGADCQRESCLLCRTKMKTEKNTQQECTRRNIVYENWCMTCENEEKEKIDNMELEDTEKKERMKNIKLYKYIGETARSSFERSLEHQRDFIEMKLDSHKLKHYLEKHKEKEMEEIEFGTRILKECRTAFERQISESVEIQKNKDHYILNSKSEYNRCALPRLTAKLGELSLDKIEKRKKVEKEQEREL